MDLEGIFAELAADDRTDFVTHSCHDTCDCWNGSSSSTGSAGSSPDRYGLGETLFDQVRRVTRDIGTNAPLMEIDVSDMAALTSYNAHYSVADMILTYVYRDRPDLLDMDSAYFCTFVSDTMIFPPSRDTISEIDMGDDIELAVSRMVLTETEQDILFKVITGDDISEEEANIIAASGQLGHCASELELKRKIAGGEDFTREDVRIARDLIRDRSIVRDLEVIRSNLERRMWSARSRFILEKNVAAYQNRTRRTILRRDERCSLDFRGHELFFRVTGVAHGVARTKTGQRVVEIHARRELFSLTPNRDLIPALFRARMLGCPEVDIAQCMFNEGFTSVKISTFNVDRYQNLMDVVVSRLFQVVAIIAELRGDHELRANFVRMDPLEKNIFLHRRMQWV
jgi:hypothetical protein